MTMFDVIRLGRELPDGGSPEDEYRTNDLKNACFHYHITFTGRIERIVPVFEVEPKERLELLTTDYARIKNFLREASRASWIFDFLFRRADVYCELLFWNVTGNPSRWERGLAAIRGGWICGSMGRSHGNSGHSIRVTGSYTRNESIT